jgi:hypothetical protein
MKLAAVGAAALFAGLMPAQCAPDSSVTATVTMTSNAFSYAQVHVVGTAGGSGKNHVQVHGYCNSGAYVDGAVVTLTYVGQAGDSILNCATGVGDWWWSTW